MMVRNSSYVSSLRLSGWLCIALLASSVSLLACAGDPSGTRDSADVLGEGGSAQDARIEGADADDAGADRADDDDAASRDTAPEDAETSDGEPADAEPADTQPNDAEPEDAAQADTEPNDAARDDAPADDAEAGDDADAASDASPSDAGSDVTSDPSDADLSDTEGDASGADGDSDVGGSDVEDASDADGSRDTDDAVDADDDADGDDATDGDALEDSGSDGSDAGDADASDGDAGVEIPEWQYPVTYEEFPTGTLYGSHWSPPALLSEIACGESALLTGGGAVEDFDGDGRLDVFLPRIGFPDQLFRNIDGSSFRDVAPELGLDNEGESNGAFWVDIDSDGDFDLYITAILGPNRLYLHPGPDEAWDSGPWDEVASVYGLDGSGGIDSRNCNQSFGMSFSDWDADGDLDALLSRWGARVAEETSVFYERGVADPDADPPVPAYVNATIALGVGFETRTVMFNSHFFDANGDGRMDVYTVSDFERAVLFVQNELGGFSHANDFARVGHEENGMGGTLGDVDQDGDLDFFTTSIIGGADTVCTLSWGCSGNRLYLANDNGTFADGTDRYGVRSSGWGWGPQFFDADLDGDLDLVVANGYSLPFDDPRLVNYRLAAAEYAEVPVRLWRNEPGVPWPDVAIESGFVDTMETRNVLTFDVDNDGDLDLLALHNREGPRLWRAHTDPVRRGVRIRIDDVARHYGLDARLAVTPRLGDDPIYVWIKPYGVFNGSLPYEAHVGMLAGLTRIARIEVSFPDGTEEVWEDVVLDGPQLVLR